MNNEDREYQEFRARYESRHPASVPALRMELPPYPRWLQWATFMMFASSAVLSGVHTIPVVHAGIPASVHPQVATVVSFAGFFCVELAILLSTYAMIGSGGLAVKTTLGLATLTALVANVYSVVTAFLATNAGADAGTLAVAVIIGVVAPGIAFLSGKMFVTMHRADRQVRTRAEEQYRKERQAWDAEIGQAWDRHLDSVQRRVQMDVQMDRDGRTFERTSNAASIVEAYLREHPEEMDRGVRDLAEMLGVGKSTVANVRQRLAASPNGSNHNGHGIEA